VEENWEENRLIGCCYWDHIVVSAGNVSNAVVVACESQEGQQGSLAPAVISIAAVQLVPSPL